MDVASCTSRSAEHSTFHGQWSTTQELEATWTVNGSADDLVWVRHEGTGANQIGVTGNAVSYNGAVIGFLSGGQNGGALTVTLIYRGHHRLLQTDVAVKIMITRDVAKAEQHRQRFLREARAAARIRHINVVQVMDVGETEDLTVYLIMELVEGPNLARRLDNHGRMGDHELLPVARGIAEGLAAIHQLGIVHRDIKPDNILIDPLGMPKISDLGLARMVDDADAQGLTATGMVVGTPTYISPEAILDSSSADAKSDIYSLGVTLYHLLAGCAPFDGRTIRELMLSHLSGDHTPLRELAPQADARLCGLIERCLDLNPKMRPTAGELAFELGASQQARVAAPAFVASQANAVPEMFRRQQQRQATPVFARTGVWIGIGVAVAVVALTVLLVMNRQWFI